MAFNPLWIPAAIQTAASFGSMFGAGGSEGLDQAQQSFLADINWKQALRNEEFQKEQFAWQQQLAQHGIKMRVDDAAAAGLSPLAALGNPGYSFTAGAFGGTSVPGGPASRNPSRWPEGLSMMGQGIGRALSAFKSPEERAMESLNFEMAKERLNQERMTSGIMETQLINAQKTLVNQPAQPPGAPSPWSSSPTGDAGGIPNKWMWYRTGKNTYELGYTPEWAAAMSGGRLSPWTKDIADMIGGMVYRVGHGVKSGFRYLTTPVGRR